MTEGGEFVVLPRLELLILEPFDGSLAGLDVEFDAFDFHLDFLHRQIGGFDGGLISRKLRFGPGLQVRDVLEVFLQAADALVACEGCKPMRRESTSALLTQSPRRLTSRTPSRKNACPISILPHSFH